MNHNQARFNPKINYSMDSKGTIIAYTTYAGKTIRATAKCHPADVWNRNKGERLARKRCKVKVAEKRYENVKRQMEEAIRKRDEAIVNAADFTQRAYEARMRLVDERAGLDRLLMNYNDD